MQAQLTNSFAGADVAQQHARYSGAIISAAKTAFLQGDQWAYSAGIVAVLGGGALVFFMFPKRDDDLRLLAAYHAEDSRSSA